MAALRAHRAASVGCRAHERSEECSKFAREPFNSPVRPAPRQAPKPAGRSADCCTLCCCAAASAIGAGRMACPATARLDRKRHEVAARAVPSQPAHTSRRVCRLLHALCRRGAAQSALVGLTTSQSWRRCEAPAAPAAARASHNSTAAGGMPKAHSPAAAACSLWAGVGRMEDNPLRHFAKIL